MPAPDALLARILAGPDDDAARRAYADHLRALGDPLGELLEVQCTLATLDEDAPERPALERRELTLLRTHDAAWRTAAGSAPKQWRRFDRGFPTDLHATAAWFLAAAPALATRVPLTRLTLTGLSAAACQQLCASPWLGQLRELRLNAHLHGGDIGSDGARALAGSPGLARLRRLALYGHQIGADGLRALITSPRLGALDELAVHSAKIDAKGVAAAVAEPAFARLAALELVHLPLTASGAARLARSPHAAGLRRLRLERCRLKARGARAILESTALASLAQLSLRENDCGGDEPVYVGPTLARTLRRLDLSLNGLDDAWARAFAAERPLPALAALNLRSNHLTIAGVAALIAAPTLAALESLCVASPHHGVVDRWGARLGELARLPAFARIKEFDAEHTGVTAAALAGLAASPHARELRWLRLNSNPIGDDGARALADSVHVTRLATLELAYAGLGPAGVEALCASQNFTRLRHLYLSGNDLGERGLHALVTSRAFPRLRVLGLYGLGEDPARRAALEQSMGVRVDIGDEEESLGVGPPPDWP